MIDMSQIQLVLSDLDETLLGSDHRVGARSKAAIDGLLRAGVIVAICTGRAPEATRHLVQELGLRYYICNNGASVHDGTQTLAERLMPPETAAHLVRFFDQRSIAVYLMRPDGYYLTRRTAATDAADAVRGFAPRLLPPERCTFPAHKVMAWNGAAAYSECQALFGESVHIIYHANYLEIAPRGVSKQWGGERLAELLEIPASAVAAVGDGRNDIEMIRWAGVGAAMGNADPLLKEVADLLLPNNDQDGTAHLFEAVLHAKTG